uniref:Uncharacterized protein n=1 Tax=Vespula pensylvanica TaxID=30213 RepID=A0A834P6B0_VESPE|nr:hypothetical protein H0235_006217 [Vespula pensylvanica]
MYEDKTRKRQRAWKTPKKSLIHIHQAYKTSRESEKGTERNGREKERDKDSRDIRSKIKGFPKGLFYRTIFFGYRDSPVTKIHLRGSVVCSRKLSTLRISPMFSTR